MITLSSLEDLAFFRETEEVECKLAQGRDGQGQLPNDFWPTYSAFANTRGGTIFLGLREKSLGFDLVGLPNPSKIKTDFFNQLNNPQKISANLLSGMMVEEISIEGKIILSIKVPAAGRKYRPVHINGNPLTGTYRRSDDGDRLCDGETVRRMLAEQVQDSRDNRVLRNFDISDLSAESVASYRQVLRDTRKNHPFLDFEDSVFLRKIGAIRKDRENNVEGLTVAGLLMFGLSENIRDEFPNYHLDYQERPRAQIEQRWIDRVTLDGTWSGNIFDFYRRVYRKLVADLKVPFALRDGQRQDETVVHEALREAFVNSLVHADYSARASILIVKRPDMFGFRNPGRMRVSVEQAIVGGESDGRNRTLQSMFLLIGAGERAGSGVPKIHKGWKEQHWVAPSLYDIDEPSEQTRLELRTSDLIPPEAIETLRKRFGGRIDFLSAEERLALATAAQEQIVSHARMLSICDLHPVDLSRLLQSLVQANFLVPSGRSKGTVYRLAGTNLPNPDLIFAPVSLAEEPAEASKPLELSSKPLELSSQDLGSSREATLKTALPIIDDLSSLDRETLLQVNKYAETVSGKKKIPSSEMNLIVINICKGRFLTLKVIAEILGKNEIYLRQSVLNPLVVSGVLERAFPQAPSHPRQAYTTTQG